MCDLKLTDKKHASKAAFLCDIDSGIYTKYTHLRTRITFN